MAITSSTMKHASLAALALLSASVSASSPPVTPRQAPAEDYINSVCRPELPEDANTSSAFIVPPCIAVETIESLCQPNGTSSLALEAHAQCMCGGSFFSQWRGCQDCQLFHGARSEQDVDHFVAALDIASSGLCGSGAKPTAEFQELFESAVYTAPYPTTGASTSKDAKPSDAAVSLYYTPSASSWGPGPITGSATGATGSAGSQPTNTFTGSGDQPTATTTTASGPVTGQSGSTSISTTAAPGMAAPTAAAGVRGLLIAVAGGAMAAVL